MSIGFSSMIISLGETSQLGVHFTPSNVTNTSVIWSSSNTNVVTVSVTGFLTPVAPGEAIITARSVADPSKFTTSRVTVTTLELYYATIKVEDAEITRQQSAVDLAQTVLDGVPDSEGKSFLQARLDVVQNLIDAEAAIVVAAASGLQADIDIAQALIVTLPNGEDKTLLQSMLDAIGEVFTVYVADTEGNPLVGVLVNDFAMGNVEVTDSNGYAYLELDFDYIEVFKHIDIIFNGIELESFAIENPYLNRTLNVVLDISGL